MHGEVRQFKEKYDEYDAIDRSKWWSISLIKSILHIQQSIPIGNFAIRFDSRVDILIKTNIRFNFLFYTDEIEFVWTDGTVPPYRIEHYINSTDFRIVLNHFAKLKQSPYV